MSGLFQSLLSLLLLYKYGALFVVIFFSALALPLPISSLLLATGAFASQGYFSLPLSLTVAVGANILGDHFGYFLARRYGRQALKILRIRVPAYLERLERSVVKRPGPAIFFTRFVGATDVLANLVAGFIGIPIGTFLLYDFLGNCASTGGILYAGYLLGTNWQDFSSLFNIAGYILLGLIVIFALGFVIRYIRNSNKGY